MGAVPIEVGIKIATHALAARFGGFGRFGTHHVFGDTSDKALRPAADPDRLYRVTSPILKSSRLTAHPEVTKWHGTRRETFVIR